MDVFSSRTRIIGAPTTAWAARRACGARLGRRLLTGVAWLGALAAAAVLPGCSVLQFTYNQAPALTYWWLDGYVDLGQGPSAAQSERVREHIDDFFRWHRQTQLPDYAGLLAQVRAELPGPTTAERVCQLWADVRQKVDAGFERAVPALAELARSMTAEQIAHLERRYAEANAEFREDYLDGPADERLRKRLKRAISRAEMVYGRLDATQRQALVHAVAQSPFDAQAWLAERQRRQRDALETLDALRQRPAQRTDATQARTDAEQAVRAYWRRIQQPPDPAYAASLERLTRAQCELSSQLHNAASPAQRLAAAERLKGWETDLRALASDTRVARNP